MSRKRTIRVKCPICRKPVRRIDPDFPFCSERCRAIDLGKWASGDYIVSSPVRDISDDEIPGDPPHHDSQKHD